MASEKVPTDVALSDTVIDARGHERHPGYGMLTYNNTRIGGKGINVFGSETYHNEVVTFRLSHGSIAPRDHASEHYYEEERITEWHISKMQLADLITGSARIPVTLTMVTDGNLLRLPPVPPPRTKVEKFNEDLQKRVATVFGRITEIQTKFTAAYDENRPLTQTEKRDLNNELAMVRQDIEDNIPFLVDMFNEQMEEIIAEAKMEFRDYAAGVMGDQTAIDVDPIPSLPSQKKPK